MKTVIKRGCNQVITLSHTNVLIVSVPYFNSKYGMDICKYNADLYAYVNDCAESDSCNFRYVDINNSNILFSDLSRKGVHLSKAEKRRLFYYILHLMPMSLFTCVNYDYEIPDKGCNVLSDIDEDVFFRERNFTGQIV